MRKSSLSPSFSLAAPKKKRRAISIIIITLTGVTIAIAILAGMTYLRPNSHSLFIMNRTNSDVVITRILINGSRFDDGDRVLKPRKPGERSDRANTRLEYGFKAAGNSVLVLDIKLRAEPKRSLVATWRIRTGEAVFFMPISEIVMNSHVSATAMMFMTNSFFQNGGNHVHP